MLIIRFVVGTMSRTLRSNSTPTVKAKQTILASFPRSSIGSKNQNICPPSIDEIKKAIREETKEIINALKSEIENVHVQVGRVFDRLNALELTLNSVQATQQRQENEIVRLKQSISMQENLSCDDVEAEIEDRIKRKSNLIIRGLPEPVGDNLEEVQKLNEDSLSELLKCMNIESVPPFELKRIGKKMNDRPRLLKVQFSATSDRDLVLRKSKHLRGTKFKNVYVDQDRTLKQQKEHQALIAELKVRRSMNEDVVIRGNKVVLRDDYRYTSNKRYTHFPQ